MLVCPNCGTTLELFLQRTGEPLESVTRSAPRHLGLQPTTIVEFILAGRRYSLSREDIHGAAKEAFPGTIHKYSVMLPDSEGNVQRFPILKVVRQALQTRYGEGFIEENFTTHRARDILRRLGFEVLPAAR